MSDDSTNARRPLLTADPDAPRITQRYRIASGAWSTSFVMEAHRSCCSRRKARRPSAEWRFEGHAMDSPELVIVGRWNATRAEAFHAMRDLWIERGDSLGLARVDWEKVEGALSSVRAL